MLVSYYGPDTMICPRNEIDSLRVNQKKKKEDSVFSQNEMRATRGLEGRSRRAKQTTEQNLAFILAR